MKKILLVFFIATLIIASYMHGGNNGSKGSIGNDDAIRQTIQRMLDNELKDMLILNILDFQYEVNKGEVSLHGYYTSEDDKNKLIEQISKINGVLAVHDKLKAEQLNYAVPVVNVVNLYKEPFQSSQETAVTQAVLGTPLEVLSQKEGWLYVKMPDQYEGWVASDKTIMLSERQIHAYYQFPFAQIAKNTAVIKSLDGRELMELAIGTNLKIYQVNQDSYTVLLPDQSKSLVDKADVKLISAEVPKGSAQDVINTAKRFLGIPYLWAGTTPFGFDCSGFTQAAFNLNGYSLPRDADQQFAIGTPVEMEDLKPGDLVFFSTYAPGPSHVGIYLGNSQYIQAGGSTGVSIQSFNPGDANYNANLSEHYIGARRIIQS